MEWSGLIGTIKASNGKAIAQVKLQDQPEILKGMEWISRFHPTSPTDVFSQVQTHDNLEEAHKWCLAKIKEYEKNS